MLQLNENHEKRRDTSISLGVSSTHGLMADERGDVTRPGTLSTKAEAEMDRTATPDVAPPSEHNFPDGGLRAWLVVFGVGCGLGGTFGYVNSWGVFQAYYEETLLSNHSSSTIAWIGSIQYALVFMPGMIFGRLFDMGYLKVPLACASALLVTATFLVAQCTEYWQFLLCQGIAVGLACGAIFGPLMGTIPHWFQKRLGIALGLMALGSSIGGTIFPIAVRNLIEKVGFKWTMRILGFIVMFLLGISILTAERRLPPKQNSGPFVNLRAFRNPAYCMYTASSFVVFLGLYTVLTFIDVSAVQVGVPENTAFYLLPIANAGSTLGRIGGGLVADRVGALNVMIPATFVAGVLTYAWPFATSTGANVAVAVIYGMASGVYVSLIAAPIVRMGERHDNGVRMGMYLTVLSLGALAGPPISGAINTATGGYKAVGYYAGSAVMLAVVLMLLARYFVIRKLWGKC